MFVSSRCFVSRIVLFAMLFSAVSPAFAAWRFSGNAEVLANILSEHPAVHHATQHDHAAHAKSKTPQLYCSFCLDMASVQALTLAAPRLLPPLLLAQARSHTVEQNAELAPSYSSQRPRAPPVTVV